MADDHVDYNKTYNCYGKYAQMGSTWFEDNPGSCSYKCPIRHACYNQTAINKGRVKDPVHLTDKERLAIAINAGCETVTTVVHDESIITTKHPVSIVLENGKYKVLEHRG
jgi:hypothetical protein